MKEFRFAFHLPKTDDREDGHVLKYIDYDEDGKATPKLTIVKNYKRPFWITKKFYRNHKQKKEAEDISKLDKHYSTESDLANSIFKSLKKPKFNKQTMYNVRQLPENVYVYGADITSVSMIHHEFKQKCSKVTPYSVGILDIENDPYSSVINMISYVHEKNGRLQAVLYGNKEEIPTIYDYEKKVADILVDGLPSELPKGINFDDIDIVVKLFKDEVTLIKSMMAYVHRSEIDILSGWNFLHDVGTIAKRLEYHDIEPKEVFSDPSIPKEYKHFKIFEAPATRTKQDGSTSSVPFEERWHTFESTSSFIMVDSMALYRFIRAQDKKIQGGYSLDNVLKKSINIGKLKISSIQDVTKANWHVRMLKEKPVEYGAYAIWDSLGLMAKNLTDHDLDFTLPLLSGISPFKSFSSNPSKIYDDFFLFYLEENKILGIFKGNEPKPESLGRDNWTVTLNLWKIDSDYSVPIYDTSISLSELKEGVEDELSELKKLGYNFEDRLFDSRFFVLDFDLDVTSAYPTAILVLNVSTDTVVREIISIEGMEKETFKILNMELISGVIGHIKYAVDMHDLPDTFELEEMVLEMLKK